MPLFWRYLLSQYLKVLILGTLAIIGILLVSRLEEIAHFATLGAKGSVIATFALAQIPYILPIAIPIASLISAMILAHSLSEAQELTTLRANGVSLSRLITPILVCSALVASSNFYIASEMATTSHLASRKMLFEITSINPLLLLQKAKIAKLNDAALQVDPIRRGEKAKNMILVVNHGANERLNVLLAKKLSMKGPKLTSSNTSLISSGEGATYDHLMIENQQEGTTSAPQFAYLLRQKGWKIANDHLTLPLLRARAKLLKQKIIQGTPAEKRALTHKIKKCQSEVFRRLSLALAAFTFPLIGIAFGIQIGRQGAKQKVIAVTVLAALTLVCFFTAKEFDHRLFLAAALFLLPHGLILALSLYRLSSIQRGIE